MQPRSVYIGGNYQLLPVFSNFFHNFLRKQERPGGRSYHTILFNFSQEARGETEFRRKFFAKLSFKKAEKRS